MTSSKRKKFDKGPTQACRTTGSFHHPPPDEMYSVQEKNLEQSGCEITLREYRRLVQLENDLVKKDIRFKKRVRDSYCLLLAIVENLKTAEQTYQANKDQCLTLRLIIQTIYMIQAQDDAFTWLVKELYKFIFSSLINWSDGDVPEMISRAYFEYGLLLAKKDSTLSDAILYMERCLETCQNTWWYTNDTDREFLKDDARIQICQTLLRKAALTKKSDPDSSAMFAERAANVIQKVGTRECTILYCTAKIRQAEYLLACKANQTAYDTLHRIEKIIMSNDAPKNKCEYFLFVGICNFHLFPKDQKAAIRKLNMALNMSITHNFGDLKALTLLFLGKIYSKTQATHGQARECFMEARDLFEKMREFEKEKLAQNLMAQLKAYQIFPNYLELIKRASCKHFCYLFDLMQWKQKLLKFWSDDGKLHDHRDGVQCILDENVENEVYGRL